MGIFKRDSDATYVVNCPSNSRMDPKDDDARWAAASAEIKAGIKAYKEGRK